MINKIHFVYSVPGYRRNTLFGRIVNSIRTRLFLKGYSVNIVGCRRPDEEILNKWPVQSPFENTKNTYKALSKVATTEIYHLTERKEINFSSNDIFIGHPYFPFTGDEKGITEYTVYGKKRPKTLGLITPLHCNTVLETSHINKTYLDHVNKLVEKADILFGIMGEYWWNEWDNSPYAHWKSKMVRLDMAVDTNYYPIVKTKFNPRGIRKFLYIGNNNPNKGISFLEKLAGNTGKDNYGWIGSGSDIKGVNRIAHSANLKSEYMKEIASKYDFFISTSVADANPTTILESMAWGFPVVCTPQSGYYKTDYRFNIHPEDFNESVNTLNKLQLMPEDKLIAISKKARKVVETKYTWERFTSTVVDHLGL